MKIDGITVSNFLGLPHFDHAPTEPVLFVAGGNGAGKTSLLEAVRFALTGAQPRNVSKVADRVKLVTEGAATGFVQVAFDGKDVRRAITSAKLAGEDPGLPATLALCLESSSFTAMDEADRRKLLFALSGVKMDRETVTAQLKLAGIPAHVIEEVVGKLSQGFPAAAAHAKARAADARAAWKEVAREAYGSNKAKEWTPAVEGENPTDEELAAEDNAIDRHRAKISELAEAVGRVKGSMDDADRERLEEAAANIPRATLAVEAAEAVYEGKADEVIRLESESRGHAGHSSSCPACKVALRITAAGLELDEGAASETPAKARAALADAKVAAHDASQTLKDARRELANCNAAKTTLAALPEPPTAEDMQAPELMDEENKRMRHRIDLRSMLAERRREHDTAATRAARALELHGDVEAWTAAEAQLLPDGIPSTMLAKALDPINALLSDIAAGAEEWATPSIGRDLALYYGDRAYALVSESEKWRADAMFSAMVAERTGTRFLMLDRFDVLEPAARDGAIDWLLHLIDTNAVDSMIVAGTLKAKPDLGEGIDVVWLGEQ